MKAVGMLLLLMSTLVFAAKGRYDNMELITLEDRTEKLYVEPARLCFSNEGIFFKTRAGEWRSIDHIHHDAARYYLTRSFHLEPEDADGQSAKEEDKDSWTCPSCYYINTSVNGAVSTDYGLWRPKTISCLRTRRRQILAPRIAT